MFGLFNWFGSLVIALSYLVWVLVLPFFSVWFLLSVRRDIHSICSSLKSVALFSTRLSAELDELPADKPDGTRPGVLNSMFGR